MISAFFEAGTGLNTIQLLNNQVDTDQEVRLTTSTKMPQAPDSRAKKTLPPFGPFVNDVDFICIVLAFCNRECRIVQRLRCTICGRPRFDQISLKFPVECT
jgi:hypothetical protein